MSTRRARLLGALPRALLGVLLGVPALLGSAGPGLRAEDARPLPGRLAGLGVEAPLRAQLEAEIARLGGEPTSVARSDTRLARVRLARQGLATLSVLAPLLRATDRSDALAAQLIGVLAAVNEPEAGDLLAEASSLPVPALRALAAEGLAGVAPARALAPLAVLLDDPFPGVRAAAWRALFVLEEAAAVALRCARAPDPDPALEARRLTLHRLRGEACDALRAHALAMWRRGGTGAVRLAAARLLAQPALATPTAQLLAIVRECGYGPGASLALRWAWDVPLAGHDPIEERWACVEAALGALARPDVDAAERALLVDRAMEWIAHPVPMDPQLPDPIPEHALWRRLPEAGDALLPALERRFLEGGFRAPREGTRLLAELPPETALPLLRRLVDRAQPQPVRAAASGALRMLGRLADEPLARLLVAPEEEASIRRDAIGALALEEAPWAVRVLADLLDAPQQETVEAALDALEERGEPAARAAYEAYVLAGRCPEHRVPARLARLLVTWDDLARDTFARALASEHAPLRAAALSLASRFPAARLAEVLPALVAREPRLAGAPEVEAWILALARGDPAHLLATLRARWDDLPVGASLASTRCRALAALDRVRGTRQDAAALDFALEKVLAASDPALLSHALEALAGRQGHRDPEIDRLFGRLLLGEGVEGGDERRAEVAAVTVTALGLPGRGDLTAQLLPMLARLAPDGENPHRTVALLRALAHQPWGRVEPAVLALALDATLTTAVRAAAGWLLAGRASPAVRAQVAGWLLGRQQGESDPAVLLALAAAAGRGGDAALAERFVGALEEEIRAFHAQDPPPDPLAPRLDALPARVQALAAAAAHAGAGPHVDRLVQLLVEPRYLPWAERVLEVSRLSHVTPDVLAALAPAVLPQGARLETGAEEGSVLPPEVVQVALGLKPLGDTALAEALTRVLARPEVRARFDAFPDAWPAKLAHLLHDPRSGDLAAAAAVLEAEVERLEPAASPFDLQLALAQGERHARRGRWGEAAAAARHARALLARRGDEHHGGAVRAWERLRALEAAWTACAADAANAGAGVAALEAEARAAWDDDPELLGELARAAATARVALEPAEAWARRALTLEHRAEGEESLARTAALAEVLLARGRPAAAARRLDGALSERVRPEEARLHLLLARAWAAHGDFAAARAPLRRALLAEPTLAQGLADDPAFAPYVASGQLARLLAEVELARLSGGDE